MINNTKKKSLLIFIPVVCLVLFCVSFQTVQAFSCTAYSIEIPESYTTDSKSIKDFTTFRGNNITIGIHTELNKSKDNISNYTEQEIADAAAETLSLIDSKVGSGISSTKHELTTFSKYNYPSLHMIYEGITDKTETAYVEEYIITMSRYKYTIVFSCSSSNDLTTAEINNIKDSFNVNDNMIEQKDTIPTSALIAIFSCLSAMVVCTAAAVIIHHSKHSKQK